MTNEVRKTIDKENVDEIIKKHGAFFKTKVEMEDAMPEVGDELSLAIEAKLKERFEREGLESDSVEIWSSRRGDEFYVYKDGKWFTEFNDYQIAGIENPDRLIDVIYNRYVEVQEGINVSERGMVRPLNIHNEDVLGISNEDIADLTSEDGVQM